jgi:uncharacterized oligopeptide transporter (OPT) family protein
MATVTSSSTSPAMFQPYVSATQSPAEFTAKAIVIGVLFGLLFGASTVYLGLRAGLTVSASIPIAVLAISVLKRLGGSTILENNIVQTIGSAGESVAGGVVFTLPALIFLTPYGPDYFNYFQITMLTFAGGILGVSYLPVATTAPIFAGGLVRWWVERSSGVREESDLGAGTLFSSGLIAGGSICGILFAILVGTNTIGPFQAIGNAVPWLHDATAVGQIAGGLLFLSLAVITARVARRRI